MSFRGKRRKVAEVLNQNREGDVVRHYTFTVRLECGHTAKVSAAKRYRKAERPVIGYCVACAVADVEAA